MIDDVMIFPDTWEEFEKQYGFYDIKGAYTFGNIRLIPSFRVQQWLDHIVDIERKKQSQKNKMKYVAALFSKELGEEFIVESWNKKFRVKFTVMGIDVLGYDSHLALELGHTLLIDLLTGRAVILNE